MEQVNVVHNYPSSAAPPQAGYPGRALLVSDDTQLEPRDGDRIVEIDKVFRQAGLLRHQRQTHRLRSIQVLTSILMIPAKPWISQNFLFHLLLSTEFLILLPA